MASRADATPEEQEGTAQASHLVISFFFFFMLMGQPIKLNLSPALESFNEVKAQNILYEKQQTVGRRDATAEVSHFQDL